MALQTTVNVALEKKLDTLLQQWQDACVVLSSTSAMVAHAAYQEIIELGQPVVPLLLRQLQKEPIHLFEALKSITGEDPVAPEDWGKISAMANDWLAWGRSRNLV